MYISHPIAFGFGFATKSKSGNLLDTWFPQPLWLGDAAHQDDIKFVDLVADFFGHREGTQTYHFEALSRCFALSSYMKKRYAEINPDQVRLLEKLSQLEPVGEIVTTFIDQPGRDQGVVSVPDAYLRIHLRQLGYSVSDKDINRYLSMNYWTNEGPIAPEDLEDRQIDAIKRGKRLFVEGRGRFPLWGRYYVRNNETYVDTDFGQKRMV